MPPYKLTYGNISTQKYIDIDIFGKCGSPCPISQSRVSVGTCMDNIDEYRFFLAFENTLCKDYVSEKFFNLYGDTAHTIIPVVRGGIDYDKLLPSGTFINAAHYKTPKQLTTQLNYLIDNPDQLAEIMQRKAAYRSVV